MKCHRLATLRYIILNFSKLFNCPFFLFFYDFIKTHQIFRVDFNLTFINPSLCLCIINIREQACLHKSLFRCIVCFITSFSSNFKMFTIIQLVSRSSGIIFLCLYFVFFPFRIISHITHFSLLEQYFILFLGIYFST